MADAAAGSEAAWERRFRVPTVLGAGVARRRPERGLAVANPAGRYQLHAWDVASGDLRPLTDTPDGELDGVLAPDGSQALYLDDVAGNEVGHLVRVPFAGGPPVDLTPGPRLLGGPPRGDRSVPGNDGRAAHDDPGRPRSATRGV